MASYLGTHKGADSVPKRPKMCKYSDNSSSKFVLAPRDKDESQILVKPLIEPADSEAEGIDDVTIFHQASEVSNSSQKKLTTVGNHVEQAASSHEPEKSFETLGSGQDSDRCHPRRLKRDAENSTEAANILVVSHSSNPDSTQVKRKKLVTSSDGIKKVSHINSELFGASDSEDEDKIPIDALVRKNAKKGIESLQGDPAPLKAIVDSYVGESNKSMINKVTMLQSLKDELTELEQRRLLIQGQQKKVASELQSQIDVVDKAKGEIVSSEKLMSELEATSAIADEDMASIEGLRGTVQTHRDSLVDRWNGGS
ncbi:hypothetical protein COLO4_21533 [Corchorus olitorius]|uniref:Uncharacterized protein n=1 Tax=Corchorus olitorius TaxID=93759 RepID=A0A1R3IST5_9ROSI|nr:hypothetical protein COLO4_21533 [Corchorus olitorius]